MRRPRWRRPDQFLDITVRCHHSEFRLLPTEERKAIIGFWIAKAQEKFPSVGVMSVMVMSNHLHLCIVDRNGDASRFMQYALGFMAKGINRLDQVRGAVFERRFAEIVVLDRAALVKRIAYAITNPVEANLVRSHREWTGLCLFARPASVVQRFTIFHEGRYREALRDARRTGAEVDRDAFLESAELVVGGLDERFAVDVAAAIEAREAELRQGQRGVLGMARVLQSGPFDRPQMSKRSAMPLCFGSTREARRGFLGRWCAFVAAFREASAAFRGGCLEVVFPAYSFRPGTTTR